MGQLKTAIGQLKTGLETAKAGSGSLLTGSQTLSDSLNQLNTGAKQLNRASTKISDGAVSLHSAITSLQSGTKELSTGAGTLTEGTVGIGDGAKALKEGTDKLVTGTSDLQEGAEQLKDGIKTAKDGVENSISDAGEQIKNLNGLEEYAKDPVEITRDPYAPVPNYGTAFAPYFMSLSLWVGGLMIFFGIYLDSDEKFKLLSRNSGNKIARTFIYLLIGFLQAVILGLVLLFGLGLKVNHLGMFFGSCILVSLVFISIIQFFLIFFKDIGKFLSLALLILQLTSCGGTFPMETVPGLFNALYPFMPMTYSVGLFKEAISGAGSTSLAWYNAGILIVIFFVFLGSTLLFTGAKKVKESRLTEAEA
jgi:putative membrane protein